MDKGVEPVRGQGGRGQFFAI